MSIQIQSRTLKIQPSGVRMSPDLARMAVRFAWEIDREKQLLKLFPAKNGMQDGVDTLRVWPSGERSKSKLIALRSAISQMGLDYEKLMGNVYDVKVKGRVLEVQF